MKKQYRVYLTGNSMTARYEGHVDVYADNEDNAALEAKHELTRKGGAFSDWSSSMFRVRWVERRYEA